VYKAHNHPHELSADTPFQAAKGASRSAHRPDIDGLRACAIIPVVLFHLGVPGFRGGFVGVDIFFVISGFLITGLLLRDIRKGEFSIITFYERRIRRIFPALFVIIAFCFVLGFLVFVPNLFLDMGNSVAFAALSVSNWLFLKESSHYFNTPAEYKPLLHTWSLAVEEQFYIFFPPAMVFIKRFLRGRFLPWFAAVALISFALCVRKTWVAQPRAFYLTYYRAWELMLGSIVAACVDRAPTSGLARNGITSLGLAMIVASVFGFDSATHFPGFAAALPTVGAALLIFGESGSGEKTWSGRLLSSRPMVFIGLISYSLYLWHWPLIGFARYFSIVDLAGWQKAAVFAASIVCATLSWRFVERPFRTKQVLSNRKKLFLAAFAACCLALVAGLKIGWMQALPHRQDGSLSEYQKAGDPEWARWRTCEEWALHPAGKPELCRFGAHDSVPSFLLWGDSHARSQASGIDEASAKHGFAGYVATKSACPPLLGISEGEEACPEFNRVILEYIATHPTVGTVFLAGRWDQYATGMPFKTEGASPIRLTSVDPASRETGLSNPELFRNGLRRTIESLQALGRKVVLVGQVPEVGYDAAIAYSVAYWTGRDLNKLIAPTWKEYRERDAVAEEVFANLAGKPGFQFVDMGKALCDTLTCPVVENGYSLYRDTDHLSTYGSHRVSWAYEDVFRAMKGSQ